MRASPVGSRVRPTAPRTPFLSCPRLSRRSSAARDWSPCRPASCRGRGRRGLGTRRRLGSRPSECRGWSRLMSASRNNSLSAALRWATSVLLRSVAVSVSGGCHSDNVPLRHTRRPRERLICATARTGRGRADRRLSEAIDAESPDAQGFSVVHMSSTMGPATGHTSKRRQRKRNRGTPVVDTASDNASTTERHAAVVDIEDTEQTVSDNDGSRAVPAGV